MPPEPRPERPDFLPGYGIAGAEHDVANPSFTVFALRPARVLSWLERAYAATATRWPLDGVGAASGRDAAG
ncbi:MAG TPA: hypothetical protein VFO60_01215 [Candidatus Dormibacteraeota bacterium]|nr:hypothetical protein [Candidatus Dormibacteraeota bacterium]